MNSMKFAQLTPGHAVIFGGAGFVGKHLIKQLSRQQWMISVVTRRPHRHRDLQVIPGVRLIEDKTLTQASISAVISSGDTVINLVGILNPSRKVAFKQVHAKLPDEIAQACLAKKARRLIHISAIGASVTSASAYLRSKALGENAVLDAGDRGLSSIVLRPSIIFGADDSFTRRFEQLLRLAKGIFVAPCPDAMMQPVYVDDLVQCIAYAAAQRDLECQICDVAGPQRFSMREILSIISRLTGGSHRIIGLNSSLSMLMAQFLQFVPSQPLTPDNIRSLSVPNVSNGNFPAPFGNQKSEFEATAKIWLSPQKDRFNAYRAEARR